MKCRVLTLSIATVLLASCGGGSSDPAASSGDAGKSPAAGEKELNVYNWSDYIAEDTVPNFEKQTGIKVTYDVFDSNEMVETKLLAGSSGYDIVVPTLNFLGRQIQAGVFQPLDKSKIPNLAKLKDCGVTMLDTPSEIIPIALNYLGEDPNSQDPAVIDKAAALLKTIRPHITNFHSSQYIDSMAKGSTCVVVGWSGDVIQARDRADEAQNGVKIAYSIPKEGAPLWFDMLAIPKDAKHADNAHAFINYLLEPQVAANNTNFVSYPNANLKSTELVNKDITGDPTIYPPPEVRAKLFTFAIIPPEVDRQYTRIWTQLKTGR